MAMEEVFVKLPPDLKQAMILRAIREGKSRSALMRDALVFYMSEVAEGSPGKSSGDSDHTSSGK